MLEENSKRFIIDASFLVSYLLPDERTQHTEKIFKAYAQGEITFFSSPLLPLEVANSLRHAVPKRITKEQAISLFDDFIDYKIELLPLDETEILALSLEHKLTVYDTSYLWLARKKKLPLLTLDTKLAKLAK